MLGYALVDGFTDAERPQALARLTHAVAVAEGFIVDFAFYANRAIRLTVELELGALPRLRDALEAHDVHLFEKSAADIAKLGDVSARHRPLLAMLHVTLVHDEPELSANA